MLNLQNNRSVYLYGAAAVSLVVVGSGIAYYIIEDDRQVRRRKTARRAERATLRVLHQIKEEEQAIEEKMKAVETNIDDTECDDKAFKLKEYTLAHSNELLLQLLEKLDAIRPLTVVMGVETEAEPNEFERNLVASIKARKRSVIESIEGLFRRLDVANGQIKKEASRREEVVKEKARLEKEEAERKAREEERIEELRKENERKLQEEQERIAQEEALRRQKEEEDRLAQEALKEEIEPQIEDSTKDEVTKDEATKKKAIKEEPIKEEANREEPVGEETTKEETAKVEESVEIISQEETVLAALKEVEQEDQDQKS